MAIRNSLGIYIGHGVTRTARNAALGRHVEKAVGSRAGRHAGLADWVGNGKPGAGGCRAGVVACLIHRTSKSIGTSLHTDLQ